jgi:hypothetical protein
MIPAALVKEEEKDLPIVVNCHKEYWDTNYGIRFKNVLDPQDPQYDSGYIYIGERNYQIRMQSKWWNPFSRYIKKYGWSREQAINAYRDEYIPQHPELLAAIIPELKGTILCCWCKPEACHGDVLVELYQQQQQQQQRQKN